MRLYSMYRAFRHGKRPHLIFRVVWCSSAEQCKAKFPGLWHMWKLLPYVGRQYEEELP